MNALDTLINEYRAEQGAIALRIFETTADSYSFDRYGPARWMETIKALMALGYTPDETAVIMASKWTRWAADADRELVEYIRDPRNGCTRLALALMVYDAEPDTDTALKAIIAGNGEVRRQDIQAQHLDALLAAGMIIYRRARPIATPHGRA